MEYIWGMKQILSFLKYLKNRIQQKGWLGNYKSWHEAASVATGYDSPLIFDKIVASALTVKAGKAAFERDGVLFEKVEYDFPLLSSLFFAMASTGNRSIIDFGGGLASSYFQHKTLLDGIDSLKWTVVEQEQLVQAGVRDFQDDRLDFYSHIADAFEQRNYACVMLNCVIQYLEEPYELLREIKQHRPPFILIHATPFWHQEEDRICVQYVPSSIYTASYPCRMLSKATFLAEMSDAYELVLEIPNRFTILVDYTQLAYTGFLFKMKENVK